MPFCGGDTAESFFYDSRPASPEQATAAAAAPKWWHVSDDEIHKLVHGGESTAAPQARQAHVDAGSGAHAQDQGKDGHAGSGFAGAQDATCSPDQQGRRSRAGRTVSFRGVEEDAVDQMLRTYAPAAGSRSAPSRQQLTGGERPRGWWMVSDTELQAKIAEMAARPRGQAQQASASPAATIAVAAGPKPRSSSAAPSAQPKRLARVGGAMVGAARTRGTSAGSVSRSSGSTAASGVGADGKIAIHVFFAESGDDMMLRVNPDLRIGAPKPPPGNRFTDMYGIGASTKGFDAMPRDFDYRSREFGETRRPGWEPEWVESFKGAIRDLTGIEPAHQRLSYKNVPMTNDQCTLREFGITDGATVQMRLYKGTVLKRGETMLACSRRREAVEEKLRQQVESGTASVENFSLRQCRHLRECRADGDVWMMPKWISQSNPRLFSRVGAGLDGAGGNRAKGDFGERPIYMPDALDPHLGAVRQRVVHGS